MLIITQKVNMKDPVLGFFHEWLIEFSKYQKKILVVCLEKGEYSLPENIEVVSLGKEKGYGKIKILKNLVTLIFTRKYSNVFVHMNQEYIVVAGLFWKIFRKKILFWRNHPKGNFLTRVAVALSDIVYYTSDKSFTSRFKKAKKMPVGVSVGDFIKKEKSLNKVGYLGRISPVKNIEVILRAFVTFNEDANLELLIIGDPTDNQDDKFYYSNLKSQYGDMKNIFFKKGIQHKDISEIYKNFDISINATVPGSFDKTIIESMSFGTPVFVCQNIWSETEFSYMKNYFLYKFNDPEDLYLKIKFFYSLSQEQKDILSKEVFLFSKKYHSLSSLIKKISYDL